jgi:hypothetical protein
MPTRTVVFQSFRTQNVPEWISRCMNSARHWANLRGYDYQFLDDRFFDRIPANLRGKTSNKVILSDLARLLVSRELLNGGHDRVVWIDADVVVFSPERWTLPEEDNFYFSHELWPNPQPNGVRLDIRANNAVMVFSAGNTFLDFYIDCCGRILATETNLKNWHLGVRFLTGIRNVCPLPLLPNIAMLGGDLIDDLLRGPRLLLAAYVRAMAVPLVAANVCASYSDPTVYGRTISDADFAAIVDQCLASRGQIFNQYLPSAPDHPSIPASSPANG